jgi:hypothetical protein
MNDIDEWNIQNAFEDWMIEARLKVRRNVATYYIERKERSWIFSFFKKLGFKVKCEDTILHILTNVPEFLMTHGGSLYFKYNDIFTKGDRIQGIDEIQITKVKDQNQIMRGIRRKLQTPSPWIQSHY